MWESGNCNKYDCINVLAALSLLILGVGERRQGSLLPSEDTDLES